MLLIVLSESLMCLLALQVKCGYFVEVLYHAGKLTVWCWLYHVFLVFERAVTHLLFRRILCIYSQKDINFYYQTNQSTVIKVIFTLIKYLYNHQSKSFAKQIFYSYQHLSLLESIVPFFPNSLKLSFNSP